MSTDMKLSIIKMTIFFPQLIQIDSMQLQSKPKQVA